MPVFETLTDKKEIEMLYKCVIEEKGVHHQVDKVIEEMSELTKELIKWKHGANNLVAISIEQADTKIMLEQLEMILNNRLLVGVQMTRQLNRLNDRLASGDL